MVFPTSEITVDIRHLVIVQNGNVQGRGRTKNLG